MKTIVTHNAPDLDAVTSVWLLKRLLPGWQDAWVEFVAAGTAFKGTKPNKIQHPIETINGKEFIHVDTGLGPLDHHQIPDDTVCAASRTWDFIKTQVQGGQHWEEKAAAITRMVAIVVAVDHFKEVFWENPNADYHEFSLIGIIDGYKMQKPGKDIECVVFAMECLDALLHTFENRIWAEKEIDQNGKEFMTRWGKGIGFETINDDVIKISQKMGYAIVVRKDPRKGYVRIKARPVQGSEFQPEVDQPLAEKVKSDKEVDLTPVYEKLKDMDPKATWFLHISKKMLLNGTTKNPKMKPTILGLDEIIEVLKST